jgi:dCMP deaminase
LFPCTDCAKGIIQRGIKRVVTTNPSETQYQRFNCKFSKLMFEEAGVELVVV